jgi:hypothetical protein
LNKELNKEWKKELNKEWKKELNKEWNKELNPFTAEVAIMRLLGSAPKSHLCDLTG